MHQNAFDKRYLDKALSISHLLNIYLNTLRCVKLYYIITLHGNVMQMTDEEYFYINWRPEKLAKTGKICEIEKIQRRLLDVTKFRKHVEV